MGPGALVVSAYSGGKDSATLLAVLARIAPAKNFRLRALYIDHGLRPKEELASERATITANCSFLRVPLTIATIHRGAIANMAEQTGCGIEAAARAYRYNAYLAVAGRFGAVYVATGHTADDQAETLLMRFLQGSGPEGAQGIPACRPLGAGGVRLIRPMLDLARSDVETYLSASGLAFSEDSTNASTLYKRNKIRHTVVPALDASFPGWKKALSLGAEKARSDAESLSASANALIGTVRKGRVSIDLASFMAAPEAIRIRSLLIAAGKATGKERLSWRAARAAASALAHGSKRYDFQCVRCRIRDGVLYVARALDFPRSQGYFFIVDGAGKCRMGLLSLYAEWFHEADSVSGRDMAKQPLRDGLRGGTFAFPLIVRTRRPGDEIRTEAGTVRVDELLSAWKIAPRLRDVVPVIEDRNGIVAVLPAALYGADCPRARFRKGLCDEAADIFRIRIKGAMGPYGK
ncbi:MAG: tRNA lysidine(34) synthetase TilS [Rectinemataceae bacterium]